MQLLIMAPPGVGKGTQAAAPAGRVRGAHISTGDNFRAHIHRHTGLGRAARRYIDAGERVPDEITNAMIKERLAQEDVRDAFVLDGYPRTVHQVRTLDGIRVELGTKLDGVIELVADREEFIGRLLKRAVTIHRTDDTEEAIRRRLDLYTCQTAPLLQVYRDRGLLHQVNGVGRVEEVAGRIDNALGNCRQRPPNDHGQ